MSDATKKGGPAKDKRGGEGGLEAPKRRVRHIQPLGFRVLVRLAPDDDRSAGGLFLPQGVAQKHEDALYGEVVEVARAHADDGGSLGKNVSGVPAGAWVLFPKEAGHRVPWDHELRLVETKEVLAVVEEVDYDHTH
ncbi:MAG: co-chaperone GroES [Myxococcales bacterium]|nr:co-chaperone GroES [Myxococcales bacterium]MCB9731866.1 co-chaperone GroES [Deltaproteobacteria bacterium]